MGEATERMAKENGISRKAQDEFAHRSHVLAAKAWEEGRFAEDVMPVHIAPDYRETLDRDNLVRRDSDLAKYAELPPVFDPKHGTITAGNSSPLTDGASALLIMLEEKAKALGLSILGYVRSYAFAAVDPADQLLIGPVFATPVALDRAGVTLDDMDLSRYASSVLRRGAVGHPEVRIGRLRARASWSRTADWKNRLGETRRQRRLNRTWASVRRDRRPTDHADAA
jgi:acetyl-CoA acetyltransferase